MSYIDNWIPKVEHEKQIADLQQALVAAFIEGAKWWEYQRTEFTMWQSDQNKAMDEARARLAKGRLGVCLCEEGGNDGIR